MGAYLSHDFETQMIDLPGIGKSQGTSNRMISQQLSIREWRLKEAELNLHPYFDDGGNFCGLHYL